MSLTQDTMNSLVEAVNRAIHIAKQAGCERPTHLLLGPHEFSTLESLTRPDLINFTATEIQAVKHCVEFMGLKVIKMATRGIWVGNLVDCAVNPVNPVNPVPPTVLTAEELATALAKANSDLFKAQGERAELASMLARRTEQLNEANGDRRRLDKELLMWRNIVDDLRVRAAALKARANNLAEALSNIESVVTSRCKLLRDDAATETSLS
jgi:hypothetical protein